MDMIIMKNNQAFTSSLIISDGVGIEHRAVISLLKKHSNTKILKAFEMSKVSTKGRSIEVAWLSEIQATFLVTLMKNSALVVDFKEKLTAAFFKQRKMLQQVLSQKENSAWLEQRNKSKGMRLECTDVIKQFVNYALDQGSKNAAMYYSNISKMELKGLFFLEEKFPNMRDAMNIKQLNLIEMADEAVRASLKDGMEANLPYKQIYQLAKAKIEAIAKIFPPSPLPQLLIKQDNNNE